MKTRAGSQYAISILREFRAMKDQLAARRHDFIAILVVALAIWLFLVVGRYLNLTRFPSLEGDSSNQFARLRSISSLLGFFSVCLVFATTLRLIYWKNKPATRTDAFTIGSLLALIPLAVTFARLDAGVTSASINSALAIVAAIGASLLMYELLGTERRQASGNPDGKPVS